VAPIAAGIGDRGATDESIVWRIDVWEEAIGRFGLEKSAVRWWLPDFGGQVPCLQNLYKVK